MSKLKIRKINESGASVAAKGFWFHPINKPVASINPNDNFDFSYIGTYPLQRKVYVWTEGKYTCILFSVPNADKISSMIVVGGVETATEKILSPAELIKNLEWKYVKLGDYPETYHQTNLVITYIADKIKSAGGLLNSGFPEGWQLDISSSNLSSINIKNKLIKK